jgi:phenylpropionate dioxygenase-like ring-hydroxylating dioxygenase large terminal subunit
MIKDQWYVILESKEVKTKPVGVLRLNEKLVLWRDETGLNCIYDKCCHRGASLSLGRIVDNHLECPFHGFRFDQKGEVKLVPANGKAAKIPSTFKVNAYNVVDKYGLIWLYNGDFDKANPDEIPFFEDLREGFKYSTFSEVWNVHYTRAIENQLDVVHVPFVHASTIGKGNRTIVNGPVVKWDNDTMTIYVSNVKDTGENVALKRNEILDYEDYFKLQYRIPNTWQNLISDNVRVFAAFVPIDHEHTKIYLRFYQNFLTVPVLGSIVTSLGNIFNKKVLHQDRRVVITQIPKYSKLQMEERLIAGDLPIIEFRKKLFDLGAESTLKE